MYYDMVYCTDNNTDYFSQGYITICMQKEDACAKITMIPSKKHTSNNNYTQINNHHTRIIFCDVNLVSLLSTLNRFDLLSVVLFLATLNRPDLLSIVLFLEFNLFLLI